MNKTRDGISTQMKNYKTKLLLVNPPNSPNKQVKSDNKNWYPYSLLFLISYLYKGGYKNGEVLDLSASDDPKKELLGYLRNKKFNVIGFTSTTETRFFVWDLIKIAKKSSPKSKIIVGGDHFTYTAKQTLSKIPEIDVVVRGEGEITLFELIKAIEKNKGFRKISGITYKINNKIISNPERPVEMDLDKLNIDENALKFIRIPEGKYSVFRDMRNYEKEKLKSLYVHVGRGCPGRCVYCLYNKRKYRTRSVNSILEEVKDKIKRYGCNAFYLHDPFLLKNENFVIDFCNKILKENLKIKWYAESRLDINTELIPLMAKAGCISMDFGLESVSEKVRGNLKKGIKLEQVKKIMQVCKKNNIKIRIFTMISLPGETEKDALETIKFLKKYSNYISIYTWSITKIYPGTELEIMAKEKRIINKNFDWYNRNYKNPISDYIDSKYFFTPIWIENLSPEFIKKILKEYKMLEKLKWKNKVDLKLTPKRMFLYLFDWRKDNLKIKVRNISDYFYELISRLKWYL